MKAVIALIGRPNVGKSTLFNRLTRSRDALVANFPGLTRDRKYGTGKMGEYDYLVIDTGGLSGETEGIDEYMAVQTWAAIDEANLLLLLVDGREGMTLTDEQIAHRLRITGKKVSIIVNKTDGIDAEQAGADFYRLGFSELFHIAASQGRGVEAMINQLLKDFPKREETVEKQSYDDIRIAFVGRPNVGKSTLINRILGEERVVTFDKPGTTRDSIFIPFERDNQKYTLIDTAGIRRRAKVNEVVEKFSIVKALRAIEASNVVIMIFDAHERITVQDAHLLGLILDAGRALVLAINKWDGLTPHDREEIKRQLDVKLPFLAFAEKYFISALHGSNVGLLYEAVQEAFASAMLKVSTSRLTKMLETALACHQPPLVSGRRIKLRYAHQGGSNPFIIIIHGNQTQRIPQTYTRYLMNYFRKTLGLVGTQVRIEYKTSENPYKGRKNLLNPRQLKKKQRMMKFVKRKK